MLVLWSANLFRRGTYWNDTRLQASADLQTQQLLIDREATYQKVSTPLSSGLTSTKTFSASRTSGRIDEILRKAKLSASADIDPGLLQAGRDFQ